MYRTAILAGLVFVALPTEGERFEARYPEGSELLHSQRQVSGMEIDEVTFDGEDSLDFLKEVGFPEVTSRDVRTVRYRDTVVTAAEGRPTRVRRAFEELRKHSVEEDGEEREETGPLEGRSVLASEGAEVAEVEGDDAEIDEAYLSDHPLVRYADHLLPEEPVDVGDSWQPDEDRLRRLLGIESSPVYFESDLEERDQVFYALLGEHATFRGEAEFAEIVEHGALRCAVVAFEVEIEGDDVPFGDEQDAEAGTGSMGLELSYRGKLWYALAEGRPVAMELSMEGTVDIRSEMTFGEQGGRPTELRVKASVTDDFESTWETPE